MLLVFKSATEMLHGFKIILITQQSVHTGSIYKKHSKQTLHYTLVYIILHNLYCKIPKELTNIKHVLTLL